MKPQNQTGVSGVHTGLPVGFGRSFPVFFGNPCIYQKGCCHFLWGGYHFPVLSQRFDLFFGFGCSHFGTLPEYLRFWSGLSNHLE